MTLGQDAGSSVGRVHSIQSMGTLDGPGVRFVIFTQGCPLRCKCCHNPDTWDFLGGTLYTPEQLVSRALRFRPYFGQDGGVTVSGGEPLMQARFVTELFALCHEKGINTCLDTSGSILNGNVAELLAACRRYYDVTGRRISFEYTLIAGKNDSREAAKRLAVVLNRSLRSRTATMPIHVNLIPVNEVKESGFVRSGVRAVKAFAAVLEKNGIRATVRRTLGADINASCGQLRKETAEKAAKE